MWKRSSWLLVPTMDYRIRSVPLSSIQTADENFRITTEKNNKGLMNAIKTGGLLVPPVLLRQSGRFTIISGFRRINACLNIGFSEIEAKLLNPNNTVIDCVKIAITENALQRSLNLIEQSRALAMLVDITKTKDKRLTMEARQLGLPANKDLISKLLPLCRLPSELQQSIISGKISLAMASALSHLDLHTCLTLTAIFVQLGPSLNIQREILTNVTEIAKRDDLIIPDLLREEKFMAILSAEDLNRNQKVKKVRDYLFQKRFPHVHRAEKDFAENVKRLTLGREVQLIPPKHFESRNYTLKLNFQTPADLKKHRETIEAMIQHPALHDILA